MNKTRELLLRYQGKNGFDGVCYVRVYEQPGQLPTVIAGALEDNPGTSITNAIEMVATAVQRSQFPEGREFNLIEHYPDTIDRRGTPTYALIHFEHRATHERPNDPSNHTGTIGCSAAPSHLAAGHLHRQGHRRRAGRAAQRTGRECPPRPRRDPRGDQGGRVRGTTRPRACARCCSTRPE